MKSFQVGDGVQQRPVALLEQTVWAVHLLERGGHAHNAVRRQNLAQLPPQRARIAIVERGSKLPDKLLVLLVGVVIHDLLV
jgi:hypothetical protein